MICRRLWSWGSHLALGLGALACDRSSQPAVIGVPLLLDNPSVADVAQADLDSLFPGKPVLRIEVDRGTDMPTGDSLNSLAAAVILAGRVTALPGLIGVVGHAGSRDALVAAPVYNSNKVVQIVPTGTAEELAAAGPWTFMLAPGDSLEGEFIARFAAGRLRARTVAVFYATDEYGNGLRKKVTPALRARGIDVLVEVPLPHDEPCSPGDPDGEYARRVDNALRRGTPDLVVLATRTQESRCVMAAYGHRPALRYLAGDGTVVSQPLTDLPATNTDSLYLVTFWIPEDPSPRSRAFVDHFRRVVGRAPHHGEAMIYDALMTLGAAVREAGPDREAIRRFLQSLGRDREPLPGVTGPILFPAPASKLIMTRFEKGKSVLVDQP